MTIKTYNTFDLKAFLSDFDYDYKSEGKNIGKNWWGLRDCPFCGDSRFHLGVNLKTKKFSCFICGESSKVPRFIKESLQIPWNEVKKIVGQYIDGDVYIDDRESGDTVIFPDNISKELSDKAWDYIYGRDFEKYHIEKYKLRSTGFDGYLQHDGVVHDFRWRIIIPIIMNRKLVGYTARSYVDSDPKYRHPTVECSIIPIGSVIYNYDTLKENDTAIIVEGPTDVWRWGDGCVAMMGVKHTMKQLRFLAEKNVKKAIICFDEGAYSKAQKLANDLIGIVPIIKIVDLGGGDPGELDPIEAVQIKYQLLNS